MQNFESSMLDAALTGNVTEIEYLLTQGASIDKGSDMITPLHGAVARQQEEAVRLLLKKGARVDVQELARGFTPLHLAAREGNTSIIALLLSYGAKIDAKAKQGDTPLHQAAKAGKVDAVAQLLDQGTSIDHIDNSGNTPLSYAIAYEHETVVELLLRRQARVNISDNYQMTPLNSAVLADNLPITTLLLDAGALVNPWNTEATTPLHIAAGQSNFEITRLLLNRGAFKNPRDSQGRTPFHRAMVTHPPLHPEMEPQHRKLIVLLLKYGCYNYRHSDSLFSHYWKQTDAYIEANLSFYTALLVAGVRAPSNRILPQALAEREQHIEAIVKVWIGDTPGLLETTCRQITPQLLRSIPQLLEWIDALNVKKADHLFSLQKAAPKGDLQPVYHDFLEQLLLFSDRNPTVQSKEAKQLEAQLKAGRLPSELLLPMEAHLRQEVLVGLMEQCYPMPRSVSNHFVARVLNAPELYATFHIQRFEHDWQNPYEFSTEQLIAKGQRLSI